MCETRSSNARNLVGFWLLGLCNNFGYVIMLSAAHDILADKHNSTGNASEIIENRTGKLIPECNEIGTGAILLADILPALIVKLTAPWYIQAIPYSIKVTLVVIMGAASFPTVAVPRLMWINLLGVALASAGAGLGEITFLSLTSHYTKNTISTWSSGTGAAGVFGALSYAGLTALDVSPRDTILIMLVIPAILALSYFFLLTNETGREPVPQNGIMEFGNPTEEDNLIPETSDIFITDTAEDTPKLRRLSTADLCRKLHLMRPLIQYMIPLGLVYYAEYFINQALYELIYFPKIWLPTVQQYRWYQTIYQFGVFISRSSVNLIKIKKIWILTILQFLVATFLMLQIFFKFLPSIWIVFIVILFEGLLGGAAYVNTFYWITEDMKDSVEDCEFSMGVASVSDSLGISLAGATALPVHNLLCTL